MGRRQYWVCVYPPPGHPDREASDLTTMPPARYITETTALFADFQGLPRAEQAYVLRGWLQKHGPAGPGRLIERWVAAGLISAEELDALAREQPETGAE
jgi:hypothetical protein